MERSSTAHICATTTSHAVVSNSLDDPNLRLLILDAVQDDIEGIVQIRHAVSYWKRVWAHTFTDEHIISELRAMVRDGLLDAYDLPAGGDMLEFVKEPLLTDDDIRRYWYLPTPAGTSLWESWDPPEVADPTNRRVFHFPREPRDEVYVALMRSAIPRCSRLLSAVRDGEDLQRTGRELLSRLDPWREEVREVSEWPGTVLPGGDKATLRRFLFDEEVAEIVLEYSRSLYDWGEPELPDGPCLLREDGSPWLVSIPHERHAYLEITPDEYREIRAEVPGLSIRGPEYD